MRESGTNLVLGVDEDEAALGGLGLAKGKEAQRRRLGRRPLLRRHQALAHDLGRRDRAVVIVVFGRRGDDDGGKRRTLHEAVGQRVAAVHAVAARVGSPDAAGQGWGEAWALERSETAWPPRALQRSARRFEPPFCRASPRTSFPSSPSGRRARRTRPCTAGRRARRGAPGAARRRRGCG